MQILRSFAHESGQRGLRVGSTSGTSFFVWSTNYIYQDSLKVICASATWLIGRKTLQDSLCIEPLSDHCTFRALGYQ